MLDACDLCGGPFLKVDGSVGNGNSDSMMVNDYITMTDWYKQKRPDWFRLKEPNPFACRKCVKVIDEAGLGNYVGGNVAKFLTIQEEWWQ